MTAASCLKRPIAGRSTPWPASNGSHSHTAPRAKLAAEARFDLGLLARQPGLPRRVAAGAVPVGTGEDRVRVDDRPVGREPDGRGTTGLEVDRDPELGPQDRRPGDLVVAGEHPPAVVGRVGRRPIGQRRPHEGNRSLLGEPDGVGAHGDHPSGESLREQHPVEVRRHQGSVGPGAGDRGGSQRLLPEARAEADGDAPDCGGAEERAAVHAQWWAIAAPERKSWPNDVVRAGGDEFGARHPSELMEDGSAMEEAT